MLRVTADFETTTETTYLKENRTRVWAWCLVDIDNPERVVGKGIDLESFIAKLKEIANAEIYFHNLKFDGSFLLDYLFTHGYTFSEKKAPNTFNTLIDGMGAFYSMEIIFKRFKKRYKKVKIFDSLKKLPLKVSQIAKAFNLPVQKGEIDYHKYRPVGYEPTPEEWDYIIKDCQIVAYALQEQFAHGLDKMTIGGDSLKGFKETQHRLAFAYYYPQIDKDTDDRIRASYKGGWTYANPNQVNKRLKGISYDVNSLYPAVMYGKYGALPYGAPIEFEGAYKHDKNYPLFIIEFEAKFKVKKDHLPTIQLKGNMLFGETEYITDSKEVIPMCLTSVDFKLFVKHYDIEFIKYFGGYKFKAHDDVFRPFIDYWAEIKVNSKGGKRQLAKLMLNNLYGKFGTNPRRQNKIPYYEDKVKFSLTEVEYTKPVYTPLASFITSYARRTTITVAQNNFDRFIYADTDSVYLIGTHAPEGIEIHPTKLGAWECEGIFEDSLFLRAKTYMKTMEGKTKVKCAGMPEVVKSLVNYDNFKLGARFKGKLLPKRVKGGILLVDTDFTIKK